MNNYVYNQFKQSSLTRLLNAINVANLTTLTEHDVTFSPPQWSHNPDRQTNTKVTMIANTLSDVQGRAEFQYTRHAIGGLFGSTTPVVHLTDTMTRSIDLLESIAQRYRIRLDREDVVDEVLPLVSQTPTDYTLKMSEHSLGWVGALTISLRPVSVVLDNRITQPYGQIAEFTANPEATRAELWFGPRRVTTQTDVNHWLSDTPLAGDRLSAWMIGQIRTYYGPGWSTIAGVEEPQNLYEATVAYIGPNTADVGIPGSSEDVVVLIRLSQYCLDYSGFLILSLPEHAVRAYHDAEEPLDP